MALGAILREERERRGLSEEQVADATRMMVQMVQELEEEDFHRIAAPIYGRGFIKLYAALLELDPTPLLKEFDRLYIGPGQKPPAQPRVPLQRFGDTPGAGLELVGPAESPASAHDSAADNIRIPSPKAARNAHLQATGGKTAPASDLFGDPILDPQPTVPQAPGEETLLTLPRQVGVARPPREDASGPGAPAAPRHSVLVGASHRFEGQSFHPGFGSVLVRWIGAAVGAVAKGIAFVVLAITSGARAIWQRLARSGHSLRRLPWARIERLPWLRIGRTAAIVVPVLLVLWGTAVAFRSCAQRRSGRTPEAAELDPTVVLERILPPPAGYAD